MKDKSRQKLVDLFNELKNNKKEFLSSHVLMSENNFEDEFKQILISHGIIEIPGQSATNQKRFFASLKGYEDQMSETEIKEKWNSLKNEIQSKDRIELVENKFTKLNNFFIKQPFGSQNYPDFIIFTEKNVFPKLGH
ncbi:hypothetical protein VBM90_02050 [Mycoplasma sp. 2704]|uniref:hypothetical protein n=1 Tax=Mycoplasma sp. 2704 TaxID=3108529 RepID=UPI002B1D2337|nr:hypothetical protein [Mycoplasma sp. 2704]MEA4134580.1 hypothetical protein [Mycoplasma sp. 2704]